MIADIIGAVVEGESPKYIRKTFRTLDDMLALDRVEEVLGQYWTVGRFTDDTIMTLCVAEWLLECEELDGENLLDRFEKSYRPARRYGSGTARILEAFPEHRKEWRSLATLMFPDGSFGNGAAMRVGPIGCRYAADPVGRRRAVRTSAITTHAHPLAIIGATLQATAIATTDMQALRNDVAWFEGQGQDVEAYRTALEIMAQGLENDAPPEVLADRLGTGIAAHESVPMAIYCALRSLDDYERALTEAIFLGGDADTIACMAGAIVGARLGVQAIPRRWLARVREDFYTPARVQALGKRFLTC
jgi:poly(ADP-ribose) glycohydrolase ARH3